MERRDNRGTRRGHRTEAREKKQVHEEDDSQKPGGAHEEIKAVEAKAEPQKERRHAPRFMTLVVGTADKPLGLHDPAS